MAMRNRIERDQKDDKKSNGFNGTLSMPRQVQLAIIIPLRILLSNWDKCRASRRSQTGYAFSVKMTNRIYHLPDWLHDSLTQQLTLASHSNALPTM